MLERSQDAIFRPALILMSGRALGFLAAFLIPVVLVRLLSQDDFGSYKQLFLLFGTLFGIAQLGMAESLFYFLPNQQSDVPAYLTNTLAFLALSGALCALGMSLLREPLAELLNNPALAEFLPWLGLYFVCMLLSVVLEILMTVRKQHLLASMTYATTDFLRALLLVLPVLLWSDLLWLLAGAVIFAVLRLLATLAYLWELFHAGQLQLRQPLLSRQLAYALPFGLAGAIEVLQVNYHYYAVSYYFEPALFALYAVGCLQVPLFDFLTSSTSNVMMTAMRERLVQGQRIEAWGVWLDTTRKLALLLCPLVALLLLQAHDIIILLFTEDYAGSVPIFIVWMLAMLFALLLTDALLRVVAETRFLIVINLVQLVLIAAGIDWFLNRFGLMGAVWITLAVTAVAKVLALWRIRHVFAVPLAALLPWRALTACLLLSAVAMLPALMLKNLFHAPLLLSLVSSSMVFILAYASLLFLCGPLHEDEKQQLWQWQRDHFRKFSFQR